MVVITVATACSAVMPRLRQRKARTQVALRETCVAMVMMDYYDNHNDDDEEDHKL